MLHEFAEKSFGIRAEGVEDYERLKHVGRSLTQFLLRNKGGKLGQTCSQLRGLKYLCHGSLRSRAKSDHVGEPQRNRNIGEPKETMAMVQTFQLEALERVAQDGAVIAIRFLG
ncbi:hypothetical protein [Lutimaribacter saemankumensis]|uniref:Uncharacterized protein n=1 Tax=Lutimaribacter saemankumensis TaxID=490829 RepID=A0A1G8QY42_9RHOB|nr:hypothetical protein [Lutimaribacter saemankumensis]SDJ09672.1 hypothetical protein SAMN05421850_108146 [Lutimaribacter saemankumensis]